MPELRRDPVTGEWVIVAGERAKRPSDFAGHSRGHHTDEREECPFCPGNESLTPPEIMAFRQPGSQRNGPGWWIRVVPNKYPALAIEGDLNKTGFGVYDWMNGVGAHEVIVETSEHDKQLPFLDTRQIEDVLWAYRARYLDLKKDPRLKHILIFRNYGRVAGASLSHPHSQLVATPVVPRQVAAELEGAERYHGYRDRCVYCDMLRQETDEGQRLVCENEHFIAFEPYAAKYPFETCLLPKRHCASFAAISAEEQTAFAGMLGEALRRLHICLDDAPYNYNIHTAPCNGDEIDDFHWHLKIFPRLTIAAGFEMGTGIYINVTPPELAADCLRQVGREAGAPIPAESPVATEHSGEQATSSSS
ncbi:MAG: galactose-1-phosphate uridylyltransferase [Armatimonadota bacterium]|nr:MAG: galactose-1-phosphate uridylyltransferase [Armatimonadota bacterium]